MSEISEFWRKTWNHAALSDNMFVQIGRSSWTPLEFFLMMRDATKALDLQNGDIVLDAGGGAGWMSISMSPFVKEITLFDYAQEMVNKARASASFFGNIRVFWDDLLKIEKVNDKKYTKVVVGSVLQYLENYEQVTTALSNIYDVTSSNAKALFMHNPDLRTKEKHIKSYDRLNYSKERLEQALVIEEKRLWFDINKIETIAAKIGFSKCYETPINSKLWQSTHMFDFVVEK
jgi:tRNA/tmRNA/rRNA uracil-C5-methylase (TrmA/RlmC/RlmD family)